MKTVILAIVAICFSSAAMAEVVFKQPAAVNNCKTGSEKMALSRYLNGKSDAQVPACYKPGSLKATTPAINNCKTAMEKMALSRYLNGKSDAQAPACYKAATWVGHAKSWATCTNAEKQQVRLAQSRSGRAYPACYK